MKLHTKLTSNESENKFDDSRSASRAVFMFQAQALDFEEDQAILQLVSDSTDCKWNEIAVTLEKEFGVSGRNGKQCRERWLNHLNPNLKKDPWAPDELLTLFKFHQKHGNKWASVTEQIPGRSENGVKNQFYSNLRRQFRKSKGYEPSRQDLKKHDQFLTTQIILWLKKKVAQLELQASPPQVSKSKENIDLGDLLPIDDQSEHSTRQSEQDFIVPLEFFTELDLISPLY